MKQAFFKSQAEFRKWLERNHATEGELWVGFYRKVSGQRGISYKEALLRFCPAQIPADDDRFLAPVGEHQVNDARPFGSHQTASCRADAPVGLYLNFRLQPFRSPDL